MTKPNADSTAGALVDDAGTAGSRLGGPPARPNGPPIPTKTKNQSIRVSPAVLDAAHWQTSGFQLEFRPPGRVVVTDSVTKENLRSPLLSGKKERSTTRTVLASTFTVSRSVPLNNL